METKATSTITKTKSICIVTIKTSGFCPTSKKQVIFDHLHDNQINFIPTLKSNKIWSPTLESGEFGPAHKNQVIIHVHTKNKSFSASISSKLVSTTHTTPKSISSLHWNQVKFDPHWDQVNFDHHKNQVSFHAHTKNREISTHTQKHGQFWPPHKNHIDFGRQTKTKSMSIPQTKAKLYSTPTLK